MKKIIVNKEQRKKLERVFNCTYVTVYNALAYRTAGDIPDKIRKAAVEMGGVEMVSISNKTNA